MLFYASLTRASAHKVIAKLVSVLTYVILLGTLNTLWRPCVLAGSSFSPPSTAPSMKWRTRSSPETLRASVRSSSMSSAHHSTTSTRTGKLVLGKKLATPIKADPLGRKDCTLILSLLIWFPRPVPYNPFTVHFVSKAGSLKTAFRQ